ncbi:MAG: molybdenum cofactor biosynthesis protein MoaE [Actinobacteria bacterium]|nr:molybdenum cofactor biosynthesis protein MoaE [Actinomycetota bacterium]
MALTADPLSVGAVAAWVPRPDCGAYVVFAGTVRDHAEGRAGVTSLEYEAYAEQAEARMRAIVEESRRRWPDIGRAAVLHRTGVLQLEEVSVVVAVSTPHRGDAFEAARWCIDTLKATVPIWKRETWKEGAGWGTGARDVEELLS